MIPGDAAIYASLQEEAERLVRLAASLDALADGDAHPTPPRLAEVDLAAAIRVAAELAGPAFERAGVSLQLDLPERLPARSDPDGLAPSWATSSRTRRATPRPVAG